MIKLTIVSFYEKVSEILSDYQEHILTEENARLKLHRLIVQAKKDELQVNMSVDVLYAINQERKDGGGSTEEEEEPSMIC